MEIIDFTRAREAKLAEIARTKTEPHTRYTSMLDALYKEDLTGMEYIAQTNALHMAYRIVENSPYWGDKQGDSFLQAWSALEAIGTIGAITDIEQPSTAKSGVSGTYCAQVIRFQKSEG